MNKETKNCNTPKAGLSKIESAGKPNYSVNIDCPLKAEFLRETLEIFSNPEATGLVMGKYLYSQDNWSPVIKNSRDYYPPRAEQELFNSALRDLGTLEMPPGTAYIDLGVGGGIRSNGTLYRQ